MESTHDDAGESWTPRKRWLALLGGGRADRIPTDYQATSEVTQRLLRDLACADEEALWTTLAVDRRRFVDPRWTGEGDPWGVRYESVDYGLGSYAEPVFHPLAAARSASEVEAHAWPDPAAFDYSPVSRAAASADGFRPIHAGCFEPFLLYGMLRGLEQAFCDLAWNPEIVEAALAHIAEFHLESHRRIFEAGGGRIDLTWVAEDLGSQTGPLMSLATYRRFLLPHQIRLADLARSYGVHVMYHTDGAARMFLPDLVEKVGIEVLDPIQWRCPGMDREGLVRDFAKHVVFHGSIDNQQTLAFGSPEDVRREVAESAKIYAGARWICGPCHNLQPVTPTANIVTLYEAAARAGTS
jgi:uroporphyrinogen decarboxylase